MHAAEVAVDIKELVWFLDVSLWTSHYLSIAEHDKHKDSKLTVTLHLLPVLFKVYMTWTEGHRVKKRRKVRLEKLDLSCFISYIHVMSPQTKMDGLPFGLERKRAVIATLSMLCQTQPIEPEVGA